MRTHENIAFIVFMQYCLCQEPPGSLCAFAKNEDIMAGNAPRTTLLTLVTAAVSCFCANPAAAYEGVTADPALDDQVWADWIAQEQRRGRVPHDPEAIVAACERPSARESHS